MKIKPTDNNSLGQIIQNLDKKLPENNPSIFMPQPENQESTFDNDFLFKQLYT